MGSPKHLLPMPDGRPLYQHQIDLLHRSCLEAETIYISLAQDSELDDFLRQPSQQPRRITPEGPKVEIIIDKETSQSEESKGPASGILAAFQHDPEATWLVVACDYPCITTSALDQLKSEYKEPVTCFKNLEGFCEPLLGIWSPEAIRHLKRNCEKGKLSPSKAVKELNGLVILPDGDVDVVLKNVNTKEEWESALQLLSDSSQ
ncbi:bifunctional molybdenum cofactor biosynthesis protein [Fusarium flagelliforme]|uniref:Bifunctional molybdenum cofactor biosynthesis protein n=2 Tax=Fusarium flagelliforme TaxID=2675880 RepID=A0A395M624_9HYPO|nr:bifunctional molybdenum cofactor biosynthesis protein [Fusarium flagelliforme]